MDSEHETLPNAQEQPQRMGTQDYSFSAGAHTFQAGDWGCLLGIACAYLTIVGTTLAWHGYWCDELYTIIAVRLPIVELIHQRALHGHPPLFFLVEKLFVAFFGETETSCRSLPMLFGLVSTLLTYVVVRGSAGRTAACFACLVLVGTSTQLFICQSARSYTLLQLLVTSNSILILSPRSTSGWRVFVSALLCTAAFYTHGAAFIAVFAQLLATAIAIPSKWKYVAAGAASILAYSPFLLVSSRVEDVGQLLSWIQPPSVASVLRFPALLQFGRQLQDAPAALQVVTVVLIVALAVLAIRIGERARIFALQWFFTWAVAAAAASIGSGIVSVERYFAPALVCQAAFIALSLDHLLARRRKLAITCGTILIPISVISASLYFFIPPFVPWRDMAALIEKKRSPREVVVVDAPALIGIPFDYYYDGVTLYEETASHIAIESFDGVWVCLRHKARSASASAVPTGLQEDFPQVTRYPMSRGAVLHLTRDSIKPQTSSSLRGGVMP